VAGLDEMLSEGFLDGAATVCAGPTGIGKTLFGRHFTFDGARQGHRALVASLQEKPSQLERVASGFGWSFADDNVRLLYRSPVDVYIDERVYELLAEVEQDGVRRVLLDSLTEPAFVSGEHQRFREYVYALIPRLSRRGVSLMMTSESADVFGSAGVTPGAMESMCDNIILLRYDDNGHRIGRTLTVLKTRASGHQSDVRAFVIDDHGIRIQPAAASG